MFSYRLKSIKQPCAFCCEKVNKPVCLGQLSSYSSLKKGLPASYPSSEFSVSPSETSSVMFCLLCSLVKHSQLKRTREKWRQSCCCCCGGGFLRPTQSHASKRETCTFTRRLPDNTWQYMWEMLKNVDDAVCIFMGEIIISKWPWFQGRRKGGIGRWGGICTLLCCFLPYCKREDCKECWRLSHKGNVISAGDVAAERVGTCNFKSKTHRGTAGQCNDGIWGARLSGRWWTWRWQMKVLPAPALCQRSVSSVAEGSVCLCPACHVLSPWQGQWADGLWAAMPNHQLAPTGFCLLAATGRAHGLGWAHGHHGDAGEARPSLNTPTLGDSNQEFSLFLVQKLW